MSSDQVVEPRTGELIGDTGDRRVEILADGDDLHATWSRFAAGRDGADRHVHREHTDMFYVVEGELTVRLGAGDDEATLGAGGLASLPPFVVHGFRNASDADVIYLNLHAPGRGFADYMRSLRDGSPITYDQFDPPPGGGRDPADAQLGRREALDAPDGFRVTLLGQDENATVTEIEAGAGVGSDQLASAPDHIYVLDGSIVLEGDRVVAPGSWVRPSAGSPPDWRTGDGPASLLGISLSRN